MAEPVPEVQPAILQPKPTNSAKPRTNLPLSEFDGQLKELIANKQDEWEEDTASDVGVLVDIFRGILEEHDVTHTGEITQEHIAAVRQHFNHILPSYGRSPRLRVLSPRELREESRRRAEEAESKGEKPVRLGLKPATIRRHLGNLDHFLKHLRASHIMVGEWDLRGSASDEAAKGLTRLQ